MPRIAFLDVDQTLVDNQSSAYNENLIHFIAKHHFDQVYLVTGRNTNDFWQHVLQSGKNLQSGNNHSKWRKQLLYSVVKNLHDRGINVVGISTPYDHYLNQTTTGDSTSNLIRVAKAGDAAELFYMPFERTIARLKDSELNANRLLNEFRNQTGGDIYNNGFGENTNLAEALPMYLAAIDDTEKKGQFTYLLKRVEAANKGNLEIFFFDDKPENLQTAKALFSQHERISVHCALVDKVKDYTLPEQVVAAVSSNRAHEMKFFKQEKANPTQPVNPKETANPAQSVNTKETAKPESTDNSGQINYKKYT